MVSAHIKYAYRTPGAYLLLFFIIGGLARLSAWVHGRSLWVDEAMLALNIQQKGYSEFFGGLDYNQAAPLGFMFITKFLTSIFGESEMVFRLFPFLCANLSLLLMWHVLKTHTKLNKHSILVAMGLILLSPWMVYYSNEFKPYIVDFFATVFLVYGLLSLLNKGHSWWMVIVLIAIGVFCLLISLTSIFIMAIVGAALLVRCIKEPRSWHVWLTTLLTGFSWLTVFGLLFWFYIRHQMGNEVLETYWQEAFMPLPPKSFDELLWLVTQNRRLFHRLLHTGFDFGLAPLLVVLSILPIFFIRKCHHSLIYIGYGVFAIVIFASAIGMYPYHGRLIIFTIPAWIFLIAFGLDHVNQRCQSIVFYAVIAIPLLLPMGLFTSLRIIKPEQNQEIRQVLHHVNNHSDRTDVIYVFSASVSHINFYLPDGFAQGQQIIYFDSPEQLSKAIEAHSKQSPHKFWIVYSHMSKYISDEELLVLLEKEGYKPEGQMLLQGAGAYDMSQFSHTDKQ